MNFKKDLKNNIWYVVSLFVWLTLFALCLNINKNIYHYKYSIAMYCIFSISYVIIAISKIVFEAHRSIKL